MWKYAASLALFALPSMASAQGLVGDQITVRPFRYPTATPITVVDPGVEMVGAGATLGLAGPSPRFDIDILPISIRMDFVQDQDIGGSGPFMTFGDLDPVCPNGQIGTVASVVVNTNIDPNRVIIDGAGVAWPAWDGTVSWTDHSVIIQHTSQIRYLDGDAIQLDLVLDCSGPVSLNLDAGGVCPGVVDVALIGMTPGGNAAVVKGNAPGSSLIPAGPCAGTQLDLAGPSLVTIITDNDNDGNIFASPTLNPGVCGKPIQMVDLSTCSTSNWVYLP
jgi:hypothetical protein